MPTGGVHVRCTMVNTIGKQTSLCMRHQTNQTTVSKGYRLLSTIARYYLLKLAVSSAMFELLRQNRQNR